jgi:hypothetical protein
MSLEPNGLPPSRTPAVGRVIAGINLQYANCSKRYFVVTIGYLSGWFGPDVSIARRSPIAVAVEVVEVFMG